MKPLVVTPEYAQEQPLRMESAPLILAEDVRVNGQRLRKGQSLATDDLAVLATHGRSVHAVQLAADDVHEDDAGRRLAAAVAGPGLARREPIQSRVNIAATRKGLLRVDAARVIAMNRVPGVAVFTLLDRLPILPGKVIAGTKIAPVAVPEATLLQAEAIAAEGSEPVLQVKPYLPLRVGVLTTEGLAGAALTRFQAAVEKKLAWYSATLLEVVEVPGEASAVAKTMRQFLNAGADLILTGGGNTIDPLDPTMTALPEIGAEIIMFGAPAHPGSMFWLARHTASGVTIFNLASCSMYSRATVADLVLPWVMAGEAVGRDDLAELGYGGLLDRDMAFRFPDYDAEGADEPDES